jgi:predicted RND superfamily exporter protein
MLALLLSPVPMVRGFGILLVVGVAAALVCTLTVGAAGIALGARTAARPRRWPALEPLRAAWRGAR